MDLAVLIRQLQGQYARNRPLWGIVSSAGALVEGAGFTPSKTGTGAYTITFANAYSDVPSATLTPNSAGALAVKITAASATAVSFLIYTTTSGANTDSGFHFQILGPR